MASIKVHRFGAAFLIIGIAISLASQFMIYNFYDKQTTNGYEILLADSHLFLFRMVGIGLLTVGVTTLILHQLILTILTKEKFIAAAFLIGGLVGASLLIIGTSTTVLAQAEISKFPIMGVFVTPAPNTLSFIPLHYEVLFCPSYLLHQQTIGASVLTVGLAILVNLWIKQRMIIGLVPTNILSLKIRNP